MIFEDSFRKLLVSFNLVERRVFLIRAPQKPAEQMRTPYVVFFHVGSSPLHTMRAPLDVLDWTYQVSIYHEQQSMALALADAFRHRLDGYKGAFEGICYGGVFYRAQTFSYESDTRLYQIILEFRVLFRYLDGFQAVVTRAVKKAVPTAVTGV